MEIKDTMSFLDEEGNKQDFEVIAEIFVEEIRYLIMSPVEGNEDDAYIFRVDIEDEKEVLYFVEDDDEFKKVKKEYSNLLYSNNK